MKKLAINAVGAISGLGMAISFAYAWDSASNSDWDTYMWAALSAGIFWGLALFWLWLVGETL